MIFPRKSTGKVTSTAGSGICNSSGSSGRAAAGAEAVPDGAGTDSAAVDEAVTVDGATVMGAALPLLRLIHSHPGAGAGHGANQRISF